MYATAQGQNNPTLEHTSHAAYAVGVARPLPGGEGAPLKQPKTQRGEVMTDEEVREALRLLLQLWADAKKRDAPWLREWKEKHGRKDASE